MLAVAYVLKRRGSLLALASLVLAIHCNDGQDISPSSAVEDGISIDEIPSLTVNLSTLVFNRNSSRWTFDSLAFSGYCVSKFENGQLEQRFGIFEGRKEGPSEYWYPDGHPRSSAVYKRGKLNGIRKSWSPDSNHVLVSLLNYKQGKGHGIQKKWYPSGEPFMVLNLNMGKEEGMQKAYRKNGDLYANYEAKEGRIFGMKKAQLCFGIEDETIIYETD